MTARSSTWRPEDSPFSADEPGWVSGCRPEDDPWVTQYGFLDFPASIANPVDALPPGYPAYTAVLHNLDDPDSDRRVKWINDPDNDAWEQIKHIVDHGLGSWRFAPDNAIAQPEGGVLWTSPNFVKACTMRSSHAGEAQEVRRGVPRGRGAAGARDREADRAGRS